jgi:hypothetical protein
MLESHWRNEFSVHAVNEPFMILHYFCVIVHYAIISSYFATKGQMDFTMRQIQMWSPFDSSWRSKHKWPVSSLYICPAYLYSPPPLLSVYCLLLFHCFFCLVILLFRTTLICTWSLNMYPVVKCFHIFAKSGASGKWLFFGTGNLTKRNINKILLTGLNNQFQNYYY